MSRRSDRRGRRAPLWRLRWIAPVLVVALGLGALALDAGNRLELETIDLRFELRGDREPPRDIAVVAVDDRTFSALRDSGGDAQWPFRRSLHARVIDRLSAAGAKVIAYDVQFTEPTTAREDDALIEAVARAENVVLATTEVDRRGGHAVLGGEETLRAIGARAGNAVMPTDPGGVIRRAGYEHDRLRSFAVVAAERAAGKPIDRDALGEDGETLIDFAGGPGTITTHSFSDVLAGRVPAERLRGRIVVVGASAPSLQDVRPTSSSGDGVMAGPEIQAAAIDTVRRGTPLEDSPWPLDAAILLLLGLVAPLAATRTSPLRVLGIAVAAGAAYAGVALLAFGEGLVLRVSEPIGTLVLATIVALALQALVETFERERTRAAFARFVHPAVVDGVLDRAGSDAWLGGERLDATVLFSDLRGFTSYSETQPPDVILDILNAYLSEMTAAIMAHGGTVTSYMGDGIMALFGAPLEEPGHADRALAAAREMQERLTVFNGWLAREHDNEDGLRMGVGINTGPVMCGNVGSEERLEYTAIGDTVNTGARLEGMTKNSGYTVFVAGATYELLERRDGLELVGELAVRGRRDAVQVWGLAVGPGAVPAAEREQAALPEAQPA